MNKLFTVIAVAAICSGSFAHAEDPVSLKKKQDAQAEAVCASHPSPGLCALKEADKRNKNAPRLGMTTDQVLTGIRAPDHVNKTISPLGVHEQWVYEGRAYLYFENGSLVSIQTMSDR